MNKKSAAHPEPVEGSMNKIDLKAFLALPRAERMAKKKLCFQGAVYPLLFFNAYFSLTKNQGTPVQTIDIGTLRFSDVVCQLEMALLGNTSLYWLKDLSLLSDTVIRQYTAYIQQYQGPHQVYFFTTQPVPLTDICIVQFPDVINESEYRDLALFFQQDSGVIDTFIKALFARNKTISFENALLLIQYQLFLGRKFQSFMQHWLPRIVVSEQSLFTISQLFFARNYAQFLKEWHMMKSQYPDEFWIVFWSEQLWQALIFIEHVKRGQLAEVRRKVFRLPFSFMNKDWKMYSEPELMRAHQFLYEVDYGMKNGHATEGIDLFVHSFLIAHYK